MDRAPARTQPSGRVGPPGIESPRADCAYGRAARTGSYVPDSSRSGDGARLHRDGSAAPEPMLRAAGVLQLPTVPADIKFPRLGRMILGLTAVTRRVLPPFPWDVHSILAQPDVASLRASHAARRSARFVSALVGALLRRGGRRGLALCKLVLPFGDLRLQPVDFPGADL